MNKPGIDFFGSYVFHIVHYGIIHFILLEKENMMLCTAVQ